MLEQEYALSVRLNGVYILCLFKSPAERDKAYVYTKIYSGRSYFNENMRFEGMLDTFAAERISDFAKTTFINETNVQKQRKNIFMSDKP